MKDILRELGEWLGDSCRNAHEREEIARSIATLIVGVGVVIGVVILGTVVWLVV